MIALRSVLPAAAAAVAGLAAAFAVASSDASAQACQVDTGGGCKTDGAKCSPPAGGKCWTVKERRVLNCVCAVNKPPNALRTVRPRPPRDQPPPETQPVG